MYVCLCLSLYGREVTVGYARLWGSMGATFCHLAVLRSAIEFLFWDHWETAILVQILAGRSRELFWDHCETAVWGQIPAGRSREVMGGYGRLREVTEEENGGKWRNGRKNVKKNKSKRRKIVKNMVNMEENGGTPKLNGEQRPLGFGIR